MPPTKQAALDALRYLKKRNTLIPANTKWSIKR